MVTLSYAYTKTSQGVWKATQKGCFFVFYGTIYKKNNPKTMKKLFLKFKNFQYKHISVVIILILSTILSYFIHEDFFEKIATWCFSFLVILGLYYYFVGIYNTSFKEKNVFLGIIFLILGILFTTLISYLVFFYK